MTGARRGTLRGVTIGLLGAAAAGSGAAAQERPESHPISMPLPTGSHAVGRTVLLLTDSARREPFASDPAARREVVVYLWYPSRPGARTAPSRQPFPLLVFSPGFEETAQAYTTVLEDLASHGYVVAAIDHPYDALDVATPTGRPIPFARHAWETAVGAGPDSIIGYFKARVEVWAADSRFVLDALARRDGRRVPDLAGRIDLGRIGAFGHSMGGLATARLCQLDRRVRACMNQDSDYRGVPLLDFGDAATLSQPFMFFASDHSLIVTRRKPVPANADSIKLRRQQASQDSTLRHFRGGSYRVGVETPGFNHRSFMDTPMLRDSGQPSAQARRNLTIVRTYTRAFFDRYLGGARSTALDAAPLDSAVTVDRFAPDTVRRD